MPTASSPSQRRIPKTQTVRTLLTERARRLGPGAKMPTVAELRSEFGISVTTLHTVLGNLEAQGIVTRRHGVGIFVSDTLHRREVVLLCHPSFFFAQDTSPFWNLLVEQARKRAARTTGFEERVHLHFGAFSSGGCPVADGLHQDIEQNKVDGVIAVGLDMDAANWLEERGVPVVAFAGPAQFVVGIDSTLVPREGGRILAECGCKRIALWSALAPERKVNLSPPRDEPAEVLQHAVAPFGLAFDPGLRENGFRFVDSQTLEVSMSQQEQGFHIARDVFSRPRERWPDGLVITDDMMTRGALTAWERMGVRVGTDIQVVTHANVGSQSLLGYEDVLTHVEVDPSEIAEALFAVLETRMKGDTPQQAMRHVVPRVTAFANP